jgi:ATP-binding cassette subfamily F protein 3
LVLSSDRPNARSSGSEKAEAPKPAAKGASKFTLQQKLTNAEKALSEAQAALAKIDAALLDPTLFTRDHARAAKLSKDRIAAAEKLAQAEEAWLSASEALEA